ncbi:putative Sgs1 DNA helicase [Giardia muris]|uniref:DNA 3'-5' helicase n=1 Tax=Giardia muris TaxID=5742 RepID=A0A4Z1SN74_GIAMU|nr:putative Sgs1 DNA helicase [Giardia muris]|eukprot:TNJ27050.1 putative Sgs1 DNA helicase [Giardia muris]
MGRELDQVLRMVFGHESFRPLQREAVEAVCDGHDVLVVFPTGAGKSLVYQLAAIALKQTAVVISPLIALMDDQVTRLRALGLSVYTINSSVSMNTRVQAYDRMRENPRSISFLYITPEALSNSEFRQLFRAMVENRFIGFIAVDECHVLSDWGNTFRKSYRNLSCLRDLAPNVPIIALTATATRYTAQDIVSCLHLHPDFHIFVRSFNRPNIYYRILYCPPSTAKIGLLVQCLRAYSQRIERGDPAIPESPAAPGAVIVYCYTRAETEAVARKLVEEGFNAQYFHAGMEPGAKAALLQDWLRPQTASGIVVMVATIAFGMGIDRPDVRLVVHYNLPRSMESFYQESGRAGRDGEPAVSVVIFDLGDIGPAITRVQRENSQFELYSLYSFLLYALRKRCRRASLLGYFNSGVEEDSSLGSTCCDVCAGRISQMASEYLDARDSIEQKLNSCLTGSGKQFRGSLRDFGQSGTSSVLSQNERREVVKDKKKNSEHLSEPPAKQRPTEPEEQPQGKYEQRLVTYLRTLLVHLPDSVLHEGLVEIEEMVVALAGGDSIKRAGCYRHLYTALRKTATYPTRDVIASLVLAYFEA